MIQPDLITEKYNILMEKGDEMVRFIEGLDEINRANDAEGLPMVYSADKEERMNDQGKFSVLVVSKFGLDPANPKRAIRIAEYTPVDINGEIIQESHQMVRHASIVLQSKGIARYQEKRHIKLVAAAMNDVKFNFPSDAEKQAVKVDKI
jgi:hypothetical protein